MLTNLRLLWFSETNVSYNVSLPLLQVCNVQVRTLEQGPTLVVRSGQRAGNYSFGFRIDPEERLALAHRTLVRLWRVFHASPFYGVTFETKDVPVQHVVQIEPDDVEITGSGGADDGPGATKEASDAFAAYVAAASSAGDQREPVFHPGLGLAIEELRGDMTLERLWAID